MCHRSVPPDHEVEQRQFPPEFHPGRDEADQGERGTGDHLRTDAGRRKYVLRLEGGERSGSIQAAESGHHCQPL